MAKKTGLYAKVEIDVNGTMTQVMELREWSVSVSSEKVDGNVAGDDWADHLIGRKSWEGEATCVSVDEFWLGMLDQKVSIDFYDDSNDTDPTYVGTASLDFEHAVTHDDLIENTLTFTGAGALTHPTAV